MIFQFSGMEVELTHVAASLRDAKKKGRSGGEPPERPRGTGRENSQLSVHTAEAVSSCRASRFRATCSRRLIVPIGAANDSLISESDSPRM